MQFLSGRIKRSIVRFISGRSHSGKIVLIVLRFCMSFIFLVWHYYCKTNGLTSGALFASWCMLEYIRLVETLAIIQDILLTLIEI